MKKIVVTLVAVGTLFLGGVAEAGGQAGHPHGKACLTHGKAGQHGQGATHGKAGKPHGKKCGPHGKAGQHGAEDSANDSG